MTAFTRMVNYNPPRLQVSHNVNPDYDLGMNHHVVAYSDGSVVNYYTHLEPIQVDYEGPAGAYNESFWPVALAFGVVIAVAAAAVWGALS